MSPKRNYGSQRNGFHCLLVVNRKQALPYKDFQYGGNTSHNGDKAFANVVPKLWNKLPVTTLRSADKLKKLKSMLKTHLFPHWNFMIF